MALDERKMKAIENIILGENYTNVAKLSGVSRQALYNWLDDDDFKAELDRRIQEIRKQGEQRITSKIDSYIDALEKIALCGKSEKNRSDALQYLINRDLGTPTSKIADVTDDEDKDNIDKNELQDELNKFKTIQEFQKDKENDSDNDQQRTA